MTQLVSSSEHIGTDDAKVQVLVIGKRRQREFAAATATIPSASGWLNAADISEACELLDHCEQPLELIFLAQPLPGFYRQAEIDRLQQLVPLARLVIVAGTWCEGELRTGTPLNGVIRLYWYELARWWQAATRRRNVGFCPLWSLPLDHPQSGRWSSADGDLPMEEATPSVMIDAADYSVYEAISATLAENSIGALWRGRSRDVDPTATITAGIWDGGQLSKRELAKLTDFCRQINGPVIALLDFPRVEHMKQAHQAGASVVLAKPYVVEEVLSALRETDLD